MSTARKILLPNVHLAAAPQQEQQAPQLRVIAGTKGKRRSIVMPVVCVLTATGFAAAQMVITNMASEGAYELSSLTTQQRDTLRVERVLEQNTMSLNSPQNLADNAKALGMVQNVSPAYLRLSDSAILGSVNVKAEKVVSNNVSNATLANLPVTNEAGLQVARETVPAAAAALATEIKPVVWEGELPAPQTH